MCSKNISFVDSDDLLKILESKKDITLIDVRSGMEFAQGYIREALHIPLEQIPQSAKNIDKSKPLYLYCRTDQRSSSAAEFLMKCGFSDLYVVRGGILDWDKKGFAVEKPTKT